MYRVLILVSLLFLAGCGSGSDSGTTNIAPVADAGQYQYLEVGSVVHLDGSGSSDQNGDTLSYKWTFMSQPSGSTSVLEVANSVAPYFTSDLEGDYVIQLIVNDGQVDSQPDYVTISTSVFAEPSTGPQAHNEIFTPTSTAMTSRPMLVILLEFADQTFVSLPSTWQQKLFGTNTGELNDYYHEISQNQFEFAPVNDQGAVVNGVVKVIFSENHPDPNINYPSTYHPFLKSAIETVSAGGFNFADYDTDLNNAITPDELIITFIMAGEEDAYSGGAFGNGIWAHQWCTGDTYTPTVNSVKVMGCNTNGNYAIFGERHHDSIALSHNATVGIIAHELGHSTFALPDLYKTVYPYDGGIGYYGLMANGTWGQIGTQGEPGDTPTHMCAWSKIDVGWFSTSTDSNDSTADLQVNATGTADYNIIKTPFYNSTDEYFLVENRSFNGYDAGLRYVNNAFTGGIAIWHIDENTINSNLINNSVNNNTTHKGVDLEEANEPTLDTSIGDPLQNLYYTGNKTEFTPNTLPNTNLYSNARSLIFFTDVSAISDTMTVRINNPQ